MASSTEDLKDLSSILSTNINTYLEHHSTASLPLPTLKPAPPVFLTDAAAISAKDEIIKACERIITLVRPPFESMLVISLAFHETTALGLALDMKLHEHIPIQGDISLDLLAEKSGASKDIILRVLRCLTNRNCFIETSPLHYAHTAMSSTLNVLPLNSLLGHNLDDAYRSAPHVTDVLKENNYIVPEDASKTSFNKAFKTDLPYFDHIYSDPDTARADRFGLAMQALNSTSKDPHEVYTAIKSLPVGSIVVDIGGGLGQASIKMAKAVPAPKFIVQDAESVVAQGRDEKNLPKELKDRVEFQAADFFKEQPVKGADVYLLRHILHDHPDNNCRRILSNIIPAMDPEKSRIVLGEAVVPETIGPNEDRYNHIRDFQMLTLCNSSERTKSQWEALLKSVDKRLVIEKVWGGMEAGLGPKFLECRLLA